MFSTRREKEEERNFASEKEKHPNKSKDVDEHNNTDSIYYP